MRYILTAFFAFMSLSLNAQENPKNMIFVGVFCSADDKISNSFKKEAYSLGQLLMKNHLGLVTGGSKTGLMKEVVDGFLLEGKSEHLYGVLPNVFKNLNVHHPGIKKLFWSETIHSRLKDFHERCDVIVILPGGFGTLHELMDFLVHNQFGLLEKKIILINLENYWTPLIEQFKKMVAAHALQKKHLDHLIVVSTSQECIDEIHKKNPSKTNQGLSDRYWEKSKKEGR